MNAFPENDEEKEKSLRLNKYRIKKKSEKHKQKKDNAVEFANQMINLDKRFYSLIKILEKGIQNR